MEVTFQFQDVAALSLWEEPKVPSGMRLSGPEILSGRYGEENISSPCRELNSGRPARRPSLYRLSYSGS
jgi:hypothetical protein